MKILATYNIKGGVGKTASAVNLAYCAIQNNLRVLIWDLDPQGAASFYFRVKPKVAGGGFSLIQKRRHICKVIKATNYRNLDLVPADFSYRDMDLILHDRKKSKRRFEKILRQIRDDYDLIIFDCPPSISLVSENIFYCADALLIPTIPTHLSFRAYDQLKQFLKSQKGMDVSTLPFLYMVDRRKKLHVELGKLFSGRYPEALKSTISYSSIVEKMGVYRAPVKVFDQSAFVSRAFDALWNEIWGNVK